MPDSDYQVPDGFDLDGPFTQDEADIDAIMAEHEITDWRDIIIPNDFLDGFDVRPGAYFSAADAIAEAEDRGILDYCYIWWDGDDWRLVVYYTDDE